MEDLQAKGNIKNGSRTWVEYGFRQVKQELRSRCGRVSRPCNRPKQGWTDYRFTKFEQIEKWWELIYSAYLMVSLSDPVFLTLTEQSSVDTKSTASAPNFSNHQDWNHASGWKNCLNNLRLIIQTVVLLWMIYPWLKVFPNRDLLLGFHRLIAVVNQFYFGCNSS